jgi:hypothetical protein
MTPLPAPALPDLRKVSLGDMPALPSAVVDRIVQRLLPGTPAAMPPRGPSFGSSL